MFRRIFVVTVVTAATSIGLLGGQAGAIWWNVNLPAIITPEHTLDLAGTCLPEYAAAGAGSSAGLTYAMEGFAYGPATTPAIQVGCRFWDNATGEPFGTWESGFHAGPAATVAATFPVDTLDDLVACISIDRLDSAGDVISTGWIAADGSYCG